jgi:DNA gyrase subunit A
LEDDDKVISMSILRHFDATADERAAYLKMSRAVRGETEPADADAEDGAAASELSQERYAAMSAGEQLILTLAEKGYGKRTSSHEYRVTGRGGKGLVAMDIWEKVGGVERIRAKTGKIVASFPVEHADQIMLISDAGQIIRVPVDDIRIAGRSTQGVIVFKTAEEEKVVSVERLSEGEGEGEDAESA